MKLNALSDDELVASLRGICVAGRRLDARLIVHLVEVEDRRLHLKAACSSLFDFCVRRLHMSEGAALRRINAARLARRFPSLLGHIEGGTVHLSMQQCTYVDEQGRRCSSRAFLELDHIESRALGGPDDAENLRVACRAHNQLHAEEVFGQKYVARRIHFRQRKSETARAAPRWLSTPRPAGSCASDFVSKKHDAPSAWSPGGTSRRRRYTRSSVRRLVY